MFNNLIFETMEKENSAMTDVKRSVIERMFKRELVPTIFIAETQDTFERVKKSKIPLQCWKALQYARDASIVSSSKFIRTIDVGNHTGDLASSKYYYIFIIEIEGESLDSVMEYVRKWSHPSTRVKKIRIRKEDIV